MASDASRPPAGQFEWDANDYARNSRMQEEYGRKHIAALDLAGNEAVLDIGCGDGRLTALIAQRLANGRALGIDSSPRMIALARETQGARNRSLTFQLLDATALPFQAEFDLVFSTSALHWIRDHVAVLRGIHRALKPGGRMHLTFAARGTLAGFYAALSPLLRESVWASRFRGFESPYAFYGLEEYRGWLDELGFTTKRLELIERDVTHAGREAFAGWIRTTGMPYIHRVEPERRDEFISEVVDCYLRAYPADAQGLIHVAMVNLLVKARKGD